MAENKKEDATEKVVEQKKEDNVVKVNIDKPTINKEDNIIKVDLTKKPEETNEIKEETTKNTTDDSRVVELVEDAKPVQKQEEVQPEAEAQETPAISLIPPLVAKSFKYLKSDL